MPRLAMYKGPAKTLPHKLQHAAICAVTSSIYSHCELVIAGLCYSSSNRDGGVRCAEIDLGSGSWDVFDIAGDDYAILRWFDMHMGLGYDWFGALRFAFPFMPSHPEKWFCSEACAAALGLAQPHLFSPQGLLEHCT